MNDPRIDHLIRARFEAAYERLHKEPCPRWVRPSDRRQAEWEEQLQAWIPLLEATGYMLREGDDEALLCGECPCADCGGPFEAHRLGHCSCGCNPPCDGFIRDSRLGTIEAAAKPLAGEPLAEAVAHAVWHALYAPAEAAE